MRPRAAGLAILCVVLGCGRSPAPGGGPDRSIAPAPPPDSGAVAAAAAPELRPPFVPNGSPMPPAAVAGGIPPYPNAVVHVRRPRRAEMDYVEAFTPDPWEVVVEYYARRLGDWRMTRAEDTVIFEKRPDQAAVTVQPWNPDELPAGAHDEVLRTARTAIGTAWR